MDLNAAIIAHAQWKERLRRVIEGAESVDPTVVARDNVCHLGQWIHSSDSRTELSGGAYTHLREAHATFHAVAAGVARDAQSGERARAEAQLALSGEFTRTSTWVIRVLDALNRGDEQLALSLHREEPPAARSAVRVSSGRKGLLAVVLGVAGLLVLLTFGAALAPAGPLGVALRVLGCLAAAAVLVLAGQRVLTAQAVAPLSALAQVLKVPAGGTASSYAAVVADAALARCEDMSYEHRLNTSVVSASAANVAAVAETLAGRTSAAAEQSDQVSRAAEEITQAVSSIASTVEEMSASLRQISSGVAAGADLSRGVKEVVSSSSGEVSHLEEAAASVSSVVDLIVSIAEQTNMLALNATIEAARAGDVGKGFAVVAGEVKELAGATERATRGITDRVEEIQRVSATMISSMHHLDSDVATLSEQQGGMAVTVREQSESIASIAAAVHEASATLASVSSDVVTLSESIQAADDVAKVSRATAGELRGMAADLLAGTID